MNRKALYGYLLIAICLVLIGLWRATRVRVTSGASAVSYLSHWNPHAAADYLDHREVWWQDWPAAQMDHGTICVSCHTVVPYAMIRSELGRDLDEKGMPGPLKALMDSVEKRVDQWPKMEPFYSDDAGPGKSAESRATESVLNAVILLSYDTQRGHLRPITQTALDEAWALQEKTGEIAGAWKWQDFHLAPWESLESGYQGATWLMLEVENAPDGYANEPEVREHLGQLQQYLLKNYAKQPLVNRLYVLWLSSKVPELMSAAGRKTLLETLQSDQQADGGWSLLSLDPRSKLENVRWEHKLKQRLIDMVKSPESDGYATGLVVVALEESGAGRHDQMLKRGQDWLEGHQRSDGSWWAYSLNELRDPQSDIGRFMSDAATAYAMMALESGSKQQIEH
jgi:squalene-hopene/tetraprenyl-beta-curcumene cyclase